MTVGGVSDSVGRALWRLALSLNHKMSGESKRSPLSVNPAVRCAGADFSLARPRRARTRVPRFSYSLPLIVRGNRPVSLFAPRPRPSGVIWSNYG